MSRKYLDVKEFRETGLLQEVNRQFFHSLGLAMEISIDNEGCYFLSGIRDSRDDPEGILFSDPVGPEGSEYVESLRAQHAPARKQLLMGDSTIQPVGLGVEPSDKWRASYENKKL